jgi:hypothetical protein
MRSSSSSAGCAQADSGPSSSAISHAMHQRRPQRRDAAAETQGKWTGMRIRQMEHAFSSAD